MGAGGRLEYTRRHPPAPLPRIDHRQEYIIIMRDGVTPTEVSTHPPCQPGAKGESMPEAGAADGPAAMTPPVVPTNVSCADALKPPILEIVRSGPPNASPTG